MDYQKIIDRMVADQYSVIGKLHQLSFVGKFLRQNATQAVDIFSNYDNEEHAEFLLAVQEALDNIDLMEDALTDTKNLLCWMRQRRSEIFNDHNDEEE